jgi:hypothetical protein
MILRRAAIELRYAAGTEIYGDRVPSLRKRISVLPLPG